MESRNKSDDSKSSDFISMRGVGRLSFLLSDHKMSNKKKNEKKGTIFVEIDEVLLNRENNNAHNNHHRLIKVDDKK